MHSRGGGGHGSRRSRSHPRRAPIKVPLVDPVAVQLASWAERCSSSKAWSPRALSFFEPAVKVGVKVAACPPEEVASAAKNWEKVLMGYFVGLKPYVPALARYFKGLWMVKGELQVLSQGNGFLLFKFTEDSNK